MHREIAPDLPPVIGDATALRSAVQNLVANAVKYGGRDRWVGVRAQHVREKRRRSEVRITVSDHGPGIPAADLPHIFEPFYRGSRCDRTPDSWARPRPLARQAHRRRARRTGDRVDEAGRRHLVHDHAARGGRGHEREPGCDRDAGRVRIHKKSPAPRPDDQTPTTGVTRLMKAPAQNPRELGFGTDSRGTCVLNYGIRDFVYEPSAAGRG